MICCRRLGCTNRPIIRGQLCRRHWADLLAPVTRSRTCEVDGCSERHHSRGRCERHYNQLPEVRARKAAAKRAAYRPSTARAEAAARHEDALGLLECGEHPEEVARRVGITLGALDVMLRRRPTPAEYRRRVTEEAARARAMA